MKKFWDVIVIGAGIGGLTAVAYLAKEGLRVLVLDGNPHIGGTAYVFKRKGFIFPMGPLGFSHPVLVKKLFNEIGIADALNFLRIHYRVRAFGLDFPLSLTFDQMVKEFSSLFPSESDGVNQFFNDMKELISNRENPNFDRNLHASEYLRRLIKDERLIRLLGSQGTKEPYSGLPMLSAMWNLMCDIGIWFPEEGMEAFCERLRNAILLHSDSRSQIQLSKTVSKIRVNNGKAIGVTLEDGTEIDASYVISNADYKSTFLKLLEPNIIPQEWHDAISNARLSNSIFQVSLGIDTKKIDLSAFKGGSRLIYRKEGKISYENGIDWNAPRVDPQKFASQEIEVSLWGNDLEREGMGVIVLRVEADYNHFSRFRLGHRKRSEEYKNYKTQLAQALIHEVSNLLAGLEKSILVMDIATPLTFEDQGGRTQGAVAGWSWNYEDFRDGQPKELVQTPVQGLYMAGHQAFSALFMGGIPTALESGRRAAHYLIQGRGPPDKISLSGR